MELTSKNVSQVFMDCLFKDDEDTTKHIVAEGIQTKVGFHPGRLESYRENVKSMLACLPVDFQPGAGGGTTFLNACKDKDGNQWTDLHQVMDQLFQLGIGLKLAKWCMPRDMWSILPGGMPYVTVL